MARNFKLGFCATVLAFAAPFGIATNSHAQTQTTPSPVSQYQYAFQDPNLPTETRIDNLLSLMTLEEKIACFSTNTRVPRLGITGTAHVEGLHGLSLGGPRKPYAKKGQPYVPVPTTTFPQSIGLAETWDPILLRKAGGVEGYEARYAFQSDQYKTGNLIVMAPNADLGRDPRWGRTEECYGEDPYFNGTMVVAYVKGLQGDDPKYWQTAALLKHFLANSNEDDRTKSSSNFDERLFREYYSVPFRMGIVEGGSRAFMASYNAVNGIPSGVNPYLNDITVKEWGLDGIICTDGGAMKLLVTDHKYYPDTAHAVAGTIHAGITKYLEQSHDAIVEALKENLITEADINKALRGNFRVLIHLGLLDPPAMVPYSQNRGTEDPWLSEKHKAIARQVTQESIVLLKNDKNFLPLNQSKLKSIAVIGPYADKVLLDWYSGQPPYSISPLDGTKAKVGPNTTVRFARNNENNAAVDLARTSDIVIVCVGNHPEGGEGQPWAKVGAPSEGREAVDRHSITLEQEDLVKQVYAANPKTVVVLISSFPYAINWTEEHAAILHMAHNSQEEGAALADVLFGDYNPGGKLVQTWPASLNQLPPMMDYNIRHGRTYQYFKDKPLYPFGYGLSYTNFEYWNLRTNAGTPGVKGSLTVSVDVRNTGTRAGDDVVEMYITHLNSSVERPQQELQGFQRVSLNAGETKTVTMAMTGAQFSYWNVAEHKFTVEKDQVEIRIGHSASDIKLRQRISVQP